MDIHKVIIVGSGPAGYTAAIYTARANLSPILFEGFMSGPAGGQLMTTTDVENYPGFPDGILGPVMMDTFRKQSLRFGTKIYTEDVKSVDLSQRPFKVEANQTHYCHALIIATGAYAKRLDIPGTRDHEYWQKGVSACAICDGAAPIFRDKPLFVIGGGDSAMEEAVFLTKYASKVYIVHRRDEFRASKIMAERALSHSKIEVLWNSVVEEVKGNKIVESIIIRNVKNNELTEKEAGGLFFAIGHEPNTSFLQGQLDLHPNKYLKVIPGTSRTSMEGVFAAGDVADFTYRQAVTAAGMGCMAAIEAERWLAEQNIE